MPTVTIDEKGCRDCALCVEICPTRVFDEDKTKMLAMVAREQDCIGCTSCVYICPSRCIEVNEHSPQRPFYRIEENSALVSKFLQHKPVEVLLSDDDVRGALRDMSVRLHAMGGSVVETMGRGGKVVGRKAGALAASHLPEMYEGRTADEVLQRMRKRFAHSFEFDAQVAGQAEEITMTFPRCAMAAVVQSGGDKVGDAVLCQLFHEYWAGLAGSFTNRNYAVEMLGVGGPCTMMLRAR